MALVVPCKTVGLAQRYQRHDHISKAHGQSASISSLSYQLSISQPPVTQCKRCQTFSAARQFSPHPVVFLAWPSPPTSPSNVFNSCNKKNKNANAKAKLESNAAPPSFKSFLDAPAPTGRNVHTNSTHRCCAGAHIHSCAPRAGDCHTSHWSVVISGAACHAALRLAHIVNLRCVPCLRAAQRAERRLIDSWVHRAHKKGLSRQQAVKWVRRKVGPDISTWRVRADGSLGSSVPCTLCRREIIRFGFRLTCAVNASAVFHGRLSDAGAPQSKLTSQQRLAVQSKRRGPVGAAGGWGAMKESVVLDRLRRGTHARSVVTLARSSTWVCWPGCSSSTADRRAELCCDSIVKLQWTCCALARCALVYSRLGGGSVRFQALCHCAHANLNA